MTDDKPPRVGAGPADPAQPGSDLDLVDPALVARVRRAVAPQLAARLAGSAPLDEWARRELARSLIVKEIASREHDQLRAGATPLSDDSRRAVAQAVLAALFGLGRLQPLVDDPDVENIEVDGCDHVWVSYSDGRDLPGPPAAGSDTELIEMLQLLAARSGNAERSFTPAHPALHLRLPDGSRLAAVAWLTPRPHLVIRRHRINDVDLEDLVAMGTVDSVLAAFLRAAIRAGRNVVVSGLQNAGKTTLIRALANEFGPMERFATIEKEYELHLHDLPERHPRIVAMEAREGSSEVDAAGAHAGEITLASLVNDALRFNLRRIIVGEVRGPEIIPMLEAMSTGDGSLCTLHARTADHAIDRIVTLSLVWGQAQMSEGFAYRLIAGAVDLIVHITLRDDSAQGGPKHRYVSTVLEVGLLGERGRPVVTTVFAPGPDGRAVPTHRPEGMDDFVRAGFDPRLFEHRNGTWTHPLPPRPTP
ncbi:MAG: Flp pilus assembly complex ATPase component TadA [Actinomycetales bacterium]|nr:Flp pilus assembly complex ATPase component TadA [Actinomycetales bacterium]